VHEKRLVLPSNASSRTTMQPTQVGDEGLDRISPFAFHLPQSQFSVKTLPALARD